jgi:hypothetical protein
VYLICPCLSSHKFIQTPAVSRHGNCKKKNCRWNRTREVQGVGLGESPLRVKIKRRYLTVNYAEVKLEVETLSWNHETCFFSYVNNKLIGRYGVTTLQGSLTKNCCRRQCLWLGGWFKHYLTTMYQMHKLFIIEECRLLGCVAV